MTPDYDYQNIYRNQNKDNDDIIVIKVIKEN